MLPAAVRWDGVIFVRSKVTLQEVSSSFCAGSWEIIKNLNDGDDEVGDITELVFMEIKVSEFSGFCGLPDNLSPFSHGSKR